MRLALALFLCLTLSISFSQNRHSGIIIDKETKETLEFVSVFNPKDYTVTNADGRFTFSSQKDSIIFYRVGYDKLETTFDQLKDTVFLDKSIFELNEVVVTNAKSLLQRMTDSLGSNFTYDLYKERFTMRALSKYNGEIYRLQDMKGKMAKNFFVQKTEEKKVKEDLEIELVNMRKAGRKFDERNAYLVNSSFSQILHEFSDLEITESYYDFEEKVFDNGLNTKLEFNRNTDIDSANFSGYYIIDNNDLGVKEFYFNKIFDLEYNKAKWLRYRTTAAVIHVFFEKDIEKNRYFLKFAKFEAALETTDKDRTFLDTYDLSYILETSDNFGEFLVKKNVNSNKDIFKLKYPYDAKFWNSQNQLLLTESMQDFLKKMGKENKEFKVQTNMD